MAYFFLPIELYPNITPPTVQVTASYPGANAQVVANTVAAPIEQQVNGVERMLYMSSQSTNDGNYTLTVTFEIGTDLNIAQVLVQNRVALALPQLPPQVQLEGVNTKKKLAQHPAGDQPDLAGRPLRQLYLSNFATIQLKDELLRIKGVGDITHARPARLQHAPLARPGQAGHAQPDGRRTSSTPSRTRTSRSPPGRSASSRSRRASSSSSP